MIRAICNQCGRTNVGDGYAIAQGGITHKDSCLKFSKPKVKEVKVEKPKVKKSKKDVPPSED